MNLKEFIYKEVKTTLNGMISEDIVDQAFNDAKPVEESVMSELDLLAKEAKDLKSFIKTVYKEFDNLPKSKDTLNWLKDTYTSATTDEGIEEAAKRDYKKEYEKYGKSEKAKKYRAELNKYNRQKGTYGNGDGKDASHKGGKIVGFEDESKNRGRREKSRLKKESIDEKMVSPQRGHNYYQLYRDTPIKYISGHSGIGLEVPGVLLHNEYDTFKGKKGAYIIDYFGAHFYVDLKNKFASRIVNPRDSEQNRDLIKNMGRSALAPEHKDWKKFMKESVNEGPIDRVIGGRPYKYEGDGRKGKAIVSGPMKDREKGDIIKRAKKAGYLAKPNMGGGVTIFIESVNEASSKYPNFDLDKNIRYQSGVISSGMWRYTGQEQGGAGVYRNLNNGQILAFDRNDFKYFKKHLKKHFDIDESVNEADITIGGKEYNLKKSGNKITLINKKLSADKFIFRNTKEFKDWADDQVEPIGGTQSSNFGINEEQIDEKLITFSNRAPYGQIVFMAGGAGSGKGFAIDNFIDSAGFKVRDVDEMKKAVGKLDKLGKFSVDKWYKKYYKKLSDKPGKDGGLSPKAHIEEFVLGKGLSISDISKDLRNPNNVASLHYIVDSMGLKDKWLISMLSGKNNKETLPNLLFDITAKKVSSITEVIKPLIANGYEAKNIHLIWVLANFHVAIKANKERDRMVPEDILLQTHEGAGKTMWEIMTKILPKGLNGRIDVILNKRAETIPYVDSKGNEVKVEPNQMNKLKDAQIVVKGFTSLPIKKQGGGIQPEKAWKEILKKWILDNAPKTINLSQNVNEANNDYFKTAGEAVEFAKKSAEKKGFEVDEDDWNSQITMGGKYNRLRPGVGKTHSFQIGLLKKGKPQRKGLAISLYGMDSGKYELTHYIN